MSIARRQSWVVGRMSWSAGLSGAAAIAVLAALGVPAADAQSASSGDDDHAVAGAVVLAVDDEEPAPPPPSPSDTPTGALLDRLDELEVGLPPAVIEDVTIIAGATWGRPDGDATGVAAVLDTLEPELRSLFVDADDASGEVADAVALVARGWLDLRNGARALSDWETHDLAFPVGSRDDDGVATGADELVGRAATGLELVLRGQGRLLDGYTQLRTIGAAPLPAQERIDTRAREAERFDLEVRPLVLAALSGPTTGVLVPIDRFTTDAPGIEPRAASLRLVCVDRELLAALGPDPAPEELAAAAAATPPRIDCPALPGDVEVRPGR